MTLQRLVAVLRRNPRLLGALLPEPAQRRRRLDVGRVGR
jgi:hypothetical protein